MTNCLTDHIAAICARALLAKPDATTRGPAGVGVSSPDLSPATNSCDIAAWTLAAIKEDLQ